MPQLLPDQTCYNYWLKLKDKHCPFLPDITHYAPKIKFLEQLGLAGSSVVMKVQVESKIYALKLYRFMQPAWSPQRFEYYAVTADPFFVECRTYDVLIDVGLNGKVGPTAYGWLTINKEQEETVNGMLRGVRPYIQRDDGMNDWHKTESGEIDWRRRQDTASEPIRGILLEYLDGYSLDKAVPPLNAQSLRNGLTKLHALDIVHGDFKPLNVMVLKNGECRLLDFGSARLWPNVRISKEKFNVWKKEENKSLEYFLFRLQKLRHFKGEDITSATTAEDAFGGEVWGWLERTDFPELPQAS